MKKNDITINLKKNLKELYLTEILKQYENMVKHAEKENLSYEEFLFELVEVQCITRRNNRINRFLRESKIPLEKRIENFDLKRMSKKLNNQINSLLKGLFVDHKENVLAFGNPGSGKTHLLCAIAHELINQERKVYFTTCCKLVQELLYAKKELELNRYLKKLSRYEVLIIDDIGYVQQNREEMEVLFTVLAERYERGSIMLTSNLPFSKWEKIFKDPMVTAAAIDRLVHHSIILELNIPSYRIDSAKKNNLNGGDIKV